MDQFKQKCVRIVGVSTSCVFKVALLWTDDNVSLIEYFVKESAEALKEFIRNGARLIAGVPEHIDDDQLYFKCNPDGLCGLRAARLASLLALTSCESAKDINIKNPGQRKLFILELSQRLGEVGDAIGPYHRRYVEEVIHRLSCGMTNTMADGARGVRWPDKTFLS